MWENERWIQQDDAVPVTKELEMCHDSFFPLPLNWAWRQNSMTLQAVLSTCTANEAELCTGNNKQLEALHVHNLSDD